MTALKSNATPLSFTAKKKRILDILEVPDETYTDLSPKGSIDVGIRHLIDLVNSIPGAVTTSSCSGRVSVFLEGSKASSETLTEVEVNAHGDANGHAEEQGDSAGGYATVGGKGGGRWLYISHDPLDLASLRGAYGSLLQAFLGTSGLSRGATEEDKKKSTARRYIHFKFEAMILHVLTASLEDAQMVLSAAVQAGFRESGAMGLEVSSDGVITPMVGIRSGGLAFDAIVAFEKRNGKIVPMVDETYIETLAHVANERFQTNTERIQRLTSCLQAKISSLAIESRKESFEERKARKRAEGLARQKAVQEQLTTRAARPIGDPSENLEGLTIATDSL